MGVNEDLTMRSFESSLKFMVLADFETWHYILIGFDISSLESATGWVSALIKPLFTTPLATSTRGRSRLTSTLCVTVLTVVSFTSTSTSLSAIRRRLFLKRALSYFYASLYQAN